jgi:dolichol-phosphate mannosyltransferase
MVNFIFKGACFLEPHHNNAEDHHQHSAGGGGPGSDRAAPQRRPRAVVVTPTYDEKENIADLITAVLAQQQHIPDYELHILVADGHSQDGTLEIVQSLAETNSNVHLLDVNERGIGVALYKGFEHAVDQLDADVLLQIDADFQHNPADIPRFLQEISNGYDVVAGSRFVTDSDFKMSLYRLTLSIGANQLMRMMLGIKGVTDFTTSYRAFTREIFLKVDPESVTWQEKSFIFVPVSLVRMVEAGGSVTEISMTEDPRNHGYSKMNYRGYILDIVRFSIKFRLEKLRK